MCSFFFVVLVIIISIDSVISANPGLVNADRSATKAIADSGSQTSSRQSTVRPSLVEQSDQELQKSLAIRMNESSDLRVFALQAHDAPEIGGRFYEQLATSFCRNTLELNTRLTVPAPHIANHKNAVQRDRALNKLNQLCRSFLPEELNPRPFASPGDNNFLAQSKDPAMRISNGLLNAHHVGDENALRQWTLEAMKLKDPYVLSRSPIGQMKGQAFFQGARYAGEDLQIFQSALGLSACDIGGNCNQPNFEVTWVCASQGICESSYENLRIRLLRESGATDAQVAEVLALRTSMTEAILSENVDAFFPKNSASPTAR